MVSYEVKVFNCACVSNLLCVLGLSLKYIASSYNVNMEMGFLWEDAPVACNTKVPLVQALRSSEMLNVF